MALSENKEEDIKLRYDDLCLDLNMDKVSKMVAWEAFQNMVMSYTLEGDGLHWLGCALYVACRKSRNPTVGTRKVIQGNCVSLTRLLRSAKLSLIDFFAKMKKWADMASLPSEFRDKLDRLERNFNVSTVIFKKFKPIFVEIFRDPTNDPPRPPRGRKQRRLPCTSGELLAFCWTLFINVKGHFSVISDDLVNSYHLLLCCIDWVYNNAVVGRRDDLINSSFAGLPADFCKESANMNEAPCIIKMLCDQHEGLEMEAKVIKEHYWKPYIRKLFTRKDLRGKTETLTGVLEVTNFESNSKSVNNGYDEYVLTVGDFDERVFLGEDAATRIGTPAKTPPAGARPQSLVTMANLQDHLDQTTSLTPSTPLTNRRYLKGKDAPVTPVSTATQSVSKLQHLLHGRKAEPDQPLLDIFAKECSKDPAQEIKTRMDNLGETFCEHYTKPSDMGLMAGHVDFAKKRLQLGETLYYQVLENILLDEKKRLNGKKFDFSVLLNQDIFHRSLLACCMEIVLFSYNSQRSFPWIVDVYELNPFHFYKVIETIIRSEERLSRDVVKHLNHIEETILESLAWRHDSPVWEALKAGEGATPTCEQVMFADQVENNGGVNSAQNSPNKRLEALKKSPVTAVVDRFGSPINPRRRLFTTSLPHPDGSKLITTKQIHIAAEGGDEPKTFTFQSAIAEDGRQVLIPVQLVPVKTEAEKNVKPRKQGSLALFFRKVYHLASVRLRDLCERLEVAPDLRGKIWTCFEYCLVNHVDVMRDRHLDQMVMCAIYVMSKVTNSDQQFQEIMRCYRQQPQAESHVYRSVLIECKRRRESGNSRPGSPNDEKDEKRRADRLVSIRSTSTIPATSHPPTPTRMLGMQSSFETEDRGDLIKFYNAVYVKKVKKFAMKFSQQSQEKGECPPLSPLPLVRSLPSSPRKLSSGHSIFVSPIKRNAPMSPSSKLSYCFEKSPARNLLAINRMLQNGEKKAMKRLQPDDDEGEQSGAKRLCTTGPVLQQKLLGLVADRKQQTNGTQ